MYLLYLQWFHRNSFLVIISKKNLNYVLKIAIEAFSTTVHSKMEFRWAVFMVCPRNIIIKILTSFNFLSQLLFSVVIYYLCLWPFETSLATSKEQLTTYLHIQVYRCPIFKLPKPWCKIRNYNFPLSKKCKFLFIETFVTFGF